MLREKHSTLRFGRLLFERPLDVQRPPRLKKSLKDDEDLLERAIRRCLIAFVIALACYLVFALWHNWYHFSESYISLKDSGLFAENNVLMTTHTIPGRLFVGISPDDEALYVCVRQTPQAKNSIQILTNKGSIMSLDPDSFGKDLEEDAEQMPVPDSVTAIYYLSEEGYKLYQKEDTGKLNDLTYTKELSDRIEASSTLLAKK